MNKILLSLLVFFVSLQPIVATEIDDITEAGSYRVTIKDQDENGDIIERDVLLLVKFRNTIVNDNNEEAIDGSTIVYEPNEQIEFLLKEDLIKRGKVKAWNIVTGGTVDVTDVKIDQNLITFSTKKGTSIQLEAHQLENKGMNLDSVYIQPLAGKNINITRTLMILSSLILIPIIMMVLFHINIQREFKKITKILYKK